VSSPRWPGAKTPTATVFVSVMLSVADGQAEWDGNGAPGAVVILVEHVPTRAPLPCHPATPGLMTTHSQALTTRHWIYVRDSKGRRQRTRDGDWLTKPLRVMAAEQFGDHYRYRTVTALLNADLAHCCVPLSGFPIHTVAVAVMTVPGGATLARKPYFAGLPSVIRIGSMFRPLAKKTLLTIPPEGGVGLDMETKVSPPERVALLIWGADGTGNTSAAPAPDALASSTPPANTITARPRDTRAPTLMRTTSRPRG